MNKLKSEIKNQHLKICVRIEQIIERQMIMIIVKEAWKEEREYRYKTKYLPIEWVKQFKGNALRKNEKQMQELMEDILKNGLHHPLWMEVGRMNREIKLGEGNHRLEIFDRWGWTKVPLIVGLQNNAYGGAGYEPYYYPHLVKRIEKIERGLIHPDKVFEEYKIIKIG